MNDQGTVTFRARLWSGGEGAFTRNMDGNLGIIAITNDLISALPIGGRINDAGTVSFGATLRDGTQAIFMGRGQELTRITDTGPESPFSAILPAAADVNYQETVAFRATLKDSGRTGIFTERAGEPPSTLYVTGGEFAALLGQNIQRNGNLVAFLATLSSGGDGIFLGDGLTTATIATTGDTYRAFASQVANDAGLVAFVANLTGGGKAIVTGDGKQLTTIADTSGDFSNLTGNVSINNEGQVVFTADLAAGGRGIFSAQDGAVSEIIGTGDSLFGSTVSSLADAPFSPRALNNLGQFGLLANLADGRTVWIRADPLPGVQSVVVNDGSAQRSMVTSLTVTFSAAVHLDAGAFELVRQGGSAIDVNVTEAVVDGHSVDTLTFSGAGIIGGSLADGQYTLTIHGGLVHDGFGQALDGAGTGVAGSDRVDTFFRLFGDADGDGHVDLCDLLRFGSTLGKKAGDPGYLGYFDYDGDGRVDVGDLLQLLRRLGS